MLIHTTGNLVLEEVLESQMKKKVALAVEIGEESQIKLSREVIPRRELQLEIFQTSSGMPMLQLRSQRLRLRRRRRKLLRKKKSSSVSASMISSRVESSKKRSNPEKLRASRVSNLLPVTTKRLRKFRPSSRRILPRLVELLAMSFLDSLVAKKEKRTQ